GEEPPISGANGSGTVFFSSCTLKCIYCQNYPWSQGGEGTVYSVEQLASILIELAEQGCHNWNMVSPTCWIPQIEAALQLAKQSGYELPVVYNSSGFESLETLKSVADWVSLFLVDLRYAEKESAKIGSKAVNYVEIARQAVVKMWAIAGPLVVNDDGVAESGVICRLLILPERADEVVQNLRWLAETIGTEMPVSIMAQYLPLYQAASGEYQSWGRRINRAEYDLVCDEVERLGFDTGWIQEFDNEVDTDLLGCKMKSGSGIV
ncbi:MAG: radical SAM protein, partial [Kiritimatiellae bacterium]|nr:radical SAM protein [Kiritimatiellia bacterium]